MHFLTCVIATTLLADYYTQFRMRGATLIAILATILAASYDLATAGLEDGDDAVPSSP